MLEYAEFLERKTQDNSKYGFTPRFLPEFLFDFQRDLVTWALERGRAAIFADCGLGKGPMALVWAQNVVEHTNKHVLILTPLAVGAQFVREGEKFGIPCLRSRDGALPGSASIIVSNYEQLHRFRPEDFAGVVCDESGILKHFSGATQAAVTQFMLKTLYRLLCTATAAPNDHIELGTQAEALGEMGYRDMLTMFFKQSDNSHHRQNMLNNWRKERNDLNHFAKMAYGIVQDRRGWRLKGHAQKPFWRWVASWARACRKPSDLGYDDGAFVLPPLTEQEHIIKPHIILEGMLFEMPALGLRQEREERRRTLRQRCEYVRELVDHDRQAVVWCHLNDEGDVLEKIIPNSLQVRGSDSLEYREAVVEWFLGQKCICHDDIFSAKLAIWQKELTIIRNNTIKKTESDDLKSLSFTEECMPPKESPTILNTTQPILKNGNVQKRKKQSDGDNAVSNMLPTLSTDSKKSTPLKRQERETLIPGSSVLSHGTDSPWQNTESLSSKAVPFAERPAVESLVDTDSILTMITLPEPLGDSSVPDAISPLESLTMTQTSLSEPLCICGHRSGRRVLISKSKIFGFGLNFQQCNHVVTFASHSYEQYYQSVRRCWRFGQQSPVTVDIVATEGEKNIQANMARKAHAADIMFSQLVAEMGQATALPRSVQTQSEIIVPSWLSA